MRSGIQRTLQIIGENGCLALCYCWMMRCTSREALDAILTGMDRGIIRESDCFVNDGRAFLRMISEMVYTNDGPIDLKKSYDRPEGVTTITKWHNARTGLTHFTVCDHNGNVTFDPLGDSVTVREGQPVEWRWLC